MRFLLRWMLNSAALLLMANIVEGINVESYYYALVSLALLGLVNAIIRPILVILSIPITILTLGVFPLIINAILFWFISTIVQGFGVDGFVPAFIGALSLTLVSWFTSQIFKKNKNGR